MRCLAILLVCVSFPPPSAQSQQRDPPPSGESRITGRILTESGAPLDGVFVSAILFISGSDRPARYTAVTGAEGGYVIDRVPAGRFRIMAEKPGYSGLVVEATRIDGGRIVDVDGAASGIDLVLRRTGSVSGRVTRPDGTPVEKARVSSQIRLTGGKLLGTGPGVVTDTEGRYRLDEVPPGTYVITARYSVHQEMLGKATPSEYQDWAPTFHPGASEFDRAIPITIRGGERLERIDIALQPQQRYSISGVVATEASSTLRDARLEYSAPLGMSGTLTAIGEDGQFTVTGVNGGVTLLALAESDAGPVTGIGRFDVSASMAGVRILLGPPAQVRGRVVFEGDPPASWPSLEVELATAWVRVGPNGDSRDSGRIGPDGRFAIDKVIGERRVIVTRLASPWQVTAIRRGGRDVPEGRLTLTNGQVVDDLEIVIARTP